MINRSINGQTSAIEIYNVIFGEGELTREVDSIVYPKDDDDGENFTCCF